LPRTSILLVEDDPAIRRGLSDALEFAGYEVFVCADGAGAVELATRHSPHLVLLDVVLPRGDGFDILAELRRARPQQAVIMLTARGAEEDRLRGLRGGADDYVVKPFSAAELVARVEAVLRRSAERPRDLRTLELDDRTIHLERQEVRLRDGALLRLSLLETEILRYLAANRGRPVERRELLQRVWGGNAGQMETRTVDMHVRRLRAKLEREPRDPVCLVTVRNKGYMFAEDALTGAS
jgi:DNA-binding response OmpR family regulator